MGKPQQEHEASFAHFRLNRRIVVGSVFSGLSLVGVLGVTSGERIFGTDERRKTDEEVYGEYLTGLESMIGENHEAAEVLTFLRSYRKRGSIDIALLREDESGDAKRNFYTAIVDPKKNEITYKSMETFAVVKPREDKQPTFLLLPRVPITSTWAGSVLGHEGMHLKELLLNDPRAYDNDDLDDEVRAYDLQRVLLNNASGGQFSEMITTFAGNTSDGEYKGFLTPGESSTIRELFGPPLSGPEQQLREQVSVFAINFTVAETIARSDTQYANSLKHDYLTAYDNGEIVGVQG